MRSYVARSSSRNSRPSPARSLSYQWYAAATSRSARGSATSRYSVTDRDLSGSGAHHERAVRGSDLADSPQVVPWRAEDGTSALAAAWAPARYDPKAFAGSESARP